MATRRQLAVELSEQFNVMSEKLAQGEHRELELMKRNQSLAQKLNEASRECSSLSEQVHRFNVSKESIATSLQELTDAKKLNMTLSAETEQLRRLLAAKEAECANLKAQFSNIKNGFGDLMDGATSARQQVETLSTKCKTLQQRISQADVNLIREKEKRHLLERRLDDYLLKNNTARTQHEETQSKLAQAEAEKNRLEQSYTNMSRQLSHNQDATVDELNRSQAIIRELAGRNRTLEMKISTLTDERDAPQGHMTSTVV